MIGPLNSFDQANSAWLKSSMRCAMYDIFRKLNKLGKYRTEIFEAGITNRHIQKLLADFVEKKMIIEKHVLTADHFKLAFARYFFIETVTDCGGEPVLDGELNGIQGVDEPLLPIIVVTRDKGPRQGYCKFGRKVSLDPRLMCLTYNPRELKRILERDHFGTGREEEDVSMGILSILAQPENYVETMGRFSLDSGSFNIVQKAFSGRDNQSITRIIFIRAYIHVLSRDSKNGRQWGQCDGQSQYMYNEIGKITLYNAYTFQDLWYRHRVDSKKGDEYKNLGSQFHCAWHNKLFKQRRPGPNENYPFIQQWINFLRSKNKPNHAIILEKAVSDIVAANGMRDLNSLIMHSFFFPKQKVACKDFGEIIPMKVMNGHDSQINQHARQIDHQLSVCRSRGQWEHIINYVLETGILTDMLLEAIMKVRILWCYIIIELCSPRMTMEKSEKRKAFLLNIHYNHLENYDERLRQLESTEAQRRPPQLHDL